MVWLQLRGRSVPDRLLGSRGTLLKADISVLWARWFVDALCDPSRHQKTYRGYAYVVSEIFENAEKLFSDLPPDERSAIATLIARLADAEIRRRIDRQRQSLSLEERSVLWEMSGPDQRCWICGYRFEQKAANRFLHQDVEKPSLPLFVDYIMPRGLTDRDLQVEVDHVVPVAHGGQAVDMLSLACGWCNSHKGARTSVYDVGSSARIVEHPKLGRTTVPRAYWVVRLLCLRRRCEWPQGCTRTVRDSELKVCPRHLRGSLNPTNLRVTCDEHDSLADFRLVSRNLALQFKDRSR